MPPRANLMPFLCQPHANPMATSYKPRANLIPPRANLVKTSYQPHANLLSTSCKPHVVLGYHWLPLATIDLVGDNRKFEV